LARLIQHEIDHLNDVLFTDIAKDTFPMEEYRKMREDAMARGYYR
jgi:peptide deformylase